MIYFNIFYSYDHIYRNICNICYIHSYSECACMTFYNPAQMENTILECLPLSNLTQKCGESNMTGINYALVFYSVS